MRRREFITLLGGAAAWPLGAKAQQGERVRRIGMLMPGAADDPVFHAWVGAFLQGLALSGWTLGRNVRLDTRWAMTAADIRRHAAELVALAPDVILAHGAVTVGPLLQATRTVPRSCSRLPAIRSPPAWSTVWRGRAATSPVS
jgi:putative ABC transport system substrate-binding protein